MISHHTLHGVKHVFHMGLNRVYGWLWVKSLKRNLPFSEAQNSWMLYGCSMRFISPKYGNSMYFILVIHLHFLFQSIMTLQQWIFPWKPPCSVDFPYKNLRCSKGFPLDFPSVPLGPYTGWCPDTDVQDRFALGREVAEDSLTHLAKNSGTPGKPGEYDILETLFGIALRVSVVYSIFSMVFLK